jgi:hypothetical protein
MSDVIDEFYILRKGYISGIIPKGVRGALVERFIYEGEKIPILVTFEPAINPTKKEDLERLQKERERLNPLRRISQVKTIVNLLESGLGIK